MLRSEARRSAGRRPGGLGRRRTPHDTLAGFAFGFASALVSRASVAGRARYGPGAGLDRPRPSLLMPYSGVYWHLRRPVI